MVSRETMKEALKSLKIGPKILARRSNALRDILLATEKETKQLAGSALTTKSVFSRNIWGLEGRKSPSIKCPWTSVKIGWWHFLPDTGGGGCLGNNQ